MNRIVITILTILMATPCFCQETLTQKEWESIPAGVREKIARILQANTKETPVPFTTADQAKSLINQAQTGGWMLEDGRYLYYESDFFLQLSRDREIPPEGNYVYNRWCDMTDVHSAYISPQMYRMAGKLPVFDIRGTKVDLSGIILELKGLYLLDFAQYRKSDPKVRYCRNGQRSGLRWDLRNFLEQNHYTTLMDMREDGWNTRLYIASEGETITGFVVVNLDDAFDYGRFICMEGKMSKQKFSKIIAKVIQ